MTAVIKFLGKLLVWLRLAYAPLMVFMGLAVAALVIKASIYTVNMFLDIGSESMGRVIYYALALLDVTLVVGLLLMVMGYVLFNFVDEGSEAADTLPQWCRDRFMPKSENALKIRIAVTVLLIATIDLLGEFVALSDVDVEAIVAVSARLWLMLGLYGALVVTALVLVLVVRMAISTGTGTDKE